MECFKENKRCPRHEPDELRGSSPVLRGPRGEVPRGYSEGDGNFNRAISATFSSLQTDHTGPLPGLRGRIRAYRTHSPRGESWRPGSLKLRRFLDLGHRSIPSHCILPNGVPRSPHRNVPGDARDRVELETLLKANLRQLEDRPPSGERLRLDCAIEAHIEMRVVPSARPSEGESNH